MGEIVSHCDDMILNIAEVHANITCRGYAVVWIAALCETFYDIGLATEETKKCHDLLATFSNLTQYITGVFLSSDVNLIFDSIDFLINLIDDWHESVNNVVNHCV